MKALRCLAGSYVAVASAGAILLALGQYHATEPYSPYGQPPQLEFRWISVGRSSDLSTRITRVAVSFDKSAVSTPKGAPLSTKSNRAPAHLRRLAPPALRRDDEAPPAGSERLTPELKRVEVRLRDDLTRELYNNFKLFLYVSKAQTGPIAQHMYVFEKQRNGRLGLLYDWPVSTGREQVETDLAGTEVSTRTPTGYYELDPNRFYTHHVSAEWRESMPYAMFLNWVNEGEKTGLAIHAATGNGVAQLGTRASAGCIRLAPEDARTLFNLIHDGYHGQVPRFAIDARTRTMNARGMVLRDSRGRVKFTEGYKVLVLVDNYGGENYVAAMF